MFAHAALLVYIGPRKAVPIAMKAAVAVSLARAVQVLAQTRHEVSIRAGPAWYVLTNRLPSLHRTACLQESKELTSIMDWEPPDGFAGSCSDRESDKPLTLCTHLSA